MLKKIMHGDGNLQLYRDTLHKIKKKSPPDPCVPFLGSPCIRIIIYMLRLVFN